MIMTNEEARERLEDWSPWQDIGDYDRFREALDMAIKALEQQPCEDCISREGILDAIKTWDKFGVNAEQKLIRWQDHYVPYVHLDDVRNAIANMPSITPQQARWIPVSERLPEDIKPVIVTWKNTDPKSYYQYIIGKHFIGTAHYKSGKWYWYSSVTEDLLAEYGKCDGEEFDEAIEVIAWMPLPQPYAESEE